jgi:hypothetical protein
MKKQSFLLVAAGLMSLAACSSNTPAENAAENTSDALEATADNMEDAADNATNVADEQVLENAADAADHATGNAM